jgi:hypothetical protein
VRPILTGAASGIVLATLGLGLVLVLGGLARSDALDAWVLVVGGIGLLAAVRATRAAHGPARPSALEAALERKPEPPERPRELARIEREVDLGISNAFYLHFRLRPLLRAIAANRLRSRAGLELDRAGPTVFEADEWELLRPDRPEPRDPHGRGVPLARLRPLVDRLERM